MNGLIAWWARNGVAANLLMVLILIAGLFAYFTLDREEFPSPSWNVVSVTVSWPGAGPREVEEQIVLRLEEAVADIDGVDEIVSSASEGFASVNVEKKEDGRSIDDFLNEVKARVDAVSNLPADAFPPVVRQQAWNQNLSFVTFTSTLPERQHNRLAREIRDEMAALPGGTTLVDIYGDRQEEVSIEVSEEALRRFGLTFSDVSNAIRASSINLSAGAIQTDTGAATLSIRNLADTSEEFERIVVRQNQDGSVLTVGDVANVIDGFTEERAIREVEDKPSITLSPKAPREINIVQISDAVNDYIEEKQAELPEGAELYMTYDSVEDYRSQLNLVGSNAAMGLVLVLIVLSLFLRPVVAFWVAVGIAISFMGSFIFMPTVDVSLNFLSLFGMLLVIGIVVDDALVVGESIHRETERGRTGLNAAVVGTQIVAKPVLFAVLTTMIAFSPFILIGGGTSQFTKHIAWTIILALTFSLIESFLILPAHLNHLKNSGEEGRWARFQSRFTGAMDDLSHKVYRPMISKVIKARYFTVAGFIVLFAFSMALLSQGWIKSNFMPDVEGRSVVIDITTQEGTPWARQVEIYERMSSAVDRVREAMTEEFGQDLVTSKRTYVGERGLQARIILTDGNERPISTAEVGDRFRAAIGDIPDAEEIEMQTTANGDDGSNRLFFSVEGDDASALADAAEDIKNYLRQNPSLYDVRDSLQAPTPELRFELLPGAERFGLTLADISGQVRQAYFGEEVQRLPRDGEDVRVMVRYPRERRESLDSLSAFRVRTPDGREVPLAAVATYDTAPGLDQITRIDRQQSVSVRARIAADADKGAIYGDFYGEFVPDFAARHPDVELQGRGAQQEEQEFYSNVMVLYAIALFCMYMLLAIAFGSYWQPILIMSAIPFGFMGAMFGHLIWGVPFAMFSVFGIAAAGGVVINDNLVLIDYVNRLRREGAGAYAALVEAGTVRFRPIILTSVTTFVGLIPILFEGSVNAQFLKPMVVSLAFGVLFAFFVTLLFVPALYAVGVDIARFYRWAWRGEKQPSLGQGDSLGDLPDLDAIEPGGRRGDGIAGQPAE
jgi:multidrug efflux pump subunit AcrB